MSYAIRFDFPEGPLYAGHYKDSLGWAPTLTTAIIFETAEQAQTMLENGYGTDARRYGVVIDAATGEAC